MNHFSIKITFLLVLGLTTFLFISPLQSNAQSTAVQIKRGALLPEGKSKIYGQHCNPKILSKSTSKLLVVRCEGSKRVASRSSTLGVVFLTIRDELRLSAKSCFLHATRVSSQQLEVLCDRSNGTVAATPTPTVTNTPTVTATATIVTTTLSTSLSNLALSVTGRTLNSFPSGTARTITITNTGAVTATGVSVSFPTFPSGTTASSTCNGIDLVPSASCLITITPGVSATSSCGAGTTPTPGALEVTADNSNSVLTNIVVLDYGCIYQGGYLFAMDESTAASQSIGGKVAALTDEVAPTSPFIVWSSDGAGSTAGNGSFDLIPGIDQDSTSVSGSPSFSSFSTYFASTYTNPNPFLSSSFSTCDGNSDGSCNTNNIVTFYNMFQTNYNVAGSPPFTALSSPTSLTNYAAGVCKASSSSGYADWYLPAICEMGYDADSDGSGCGTVGSPAQQNIVLNLIANSLGNFPYAYYWSSTENTLLSGEESHHAWAQRAINPGSDPRQVPADKDTGTAGVRCVRALTP